MPFISLSSGGEVGGVGTGGCNNPWTQDHRLRLDTVPKSLYDHGQDSR